MGKFFTSFVIIVLCVNFPEIPTFLELFLLLSSKIINAIKSKQIERDRTRLLKTPRNTQHFGMKKQCSQLTRLKTSVHRINGLSGIYPLLTADYWVSGSATATLFADTSFGLFGLVHRKSSGNIESVTTVPLISALMRRSRILSTALALSVAPNTSNSLMMSLRRIFQ